MTDKVRKELADILNEYHWTSIDEIDWPLIASLNALSEDFMEEFQNQLHWDWLTIQQKMSEEFIDKFKHRLHWDLMSAGPNASTKIPKPLNYPPHYEYLLPDEK